MKQERWKQAENCDIQGVNSTFTSYGSPASNCPVMLHSDYKQSGKDHNGDNVMVARATKRMALKPMLMTTYDMKAVQVNACPCCSWPFQLVQTILLEFLAVAQVFDGILQQACRQDCTLFNNPAVVMGAMLCICVLHNMGTLSCCAWHHGRCSLLITLLH